MCVATTLLVRYILGQTSSEEGAVFYFLFIKKADQRDLIRNHSPRTKQHPKHALPRDQDEEKAN